MALSPFMVTWLSHINIRMSTTISSRANIGILIVVYLRFPQFHSTWFMSTWTHQHFSLFVPPTLSLLLTISLSVTSSRIIIIPCINKSLPLGLSLCLFESRLGSEQRPLDRSSDLSTWQVSHDQSQTTATNVCYYTGGGANKSTKWLILIIRLLTFTLVILLVLFLRRC